MMALTKAHNRMIAGAQTNVLDYGAVGDGVTDDSAAIQAAINAGQHIYIPEGTYLLSTPISFIARNQIISGDGMWQTVLLGQVQIGDGDVIVPNIRRCQLHHIQVDDDGRYDYAVEINKSRDTRIEHCNISGIRQNSSVSCLYLTIALAVVLVIGLISPKTIAMVQSSATTSLLAALVLVLLMFVDQ